MRLVSRLQRTQKGQSKYKKVMMAVVVVMGVVMAALDYGHGNRCGRHMLGLGLVVFHLT